MSKVFAFNANTCFLSKNVYRSVLTIPGLSQIYLKPCQIFTLDPKKQFLKMFQIISALFHNIE